MSFAWDPIHWRTLADFQAHLDATPPPRWCRGVTIHHTYRPLPSQWRGIPSMDSLGRFYRVDKGWPSGPQLFLVAGAPNAALDGIYQGTPITEQGVHAGICNATHIGVEVAGDYDLSPWPPDVAELVHGVTVALLLWTGQTEMGVKGHRECLLNKTCPGKAIDMDVVRFEVKQRLRPPGPPPVDYAAAWGNTYPYRPNWGVPQLWKRHYQALGRPMSDEQQFGDISGQLFVGGFVVWNPAELRGVYVRQP